MKVALVHRKYTRAGGVEKNVVVLAGGLVRRGHEVHVFCNEAQTTAGALPEGVQVRKVPVVKLGTAAKYLSFARNAAAAVAAERFDIVQGFDLTTRQDVLRIGRGLMKVYRGVLQETRNPIDRLWRKFSPGSMAMASLERRMLLPDASSRIVAISRVVRKELIDAYGIPEGKIEVIYNGVDLAALSPEAAAARRDGARNALGLAASDRVVLFVGTGFRRKGLETLLDAFSRLAKADASARLVIAGRDGRTDHYQGRARELGIAARTVFAGSVMADAALYGAADVLALPTRYEPFGNVVLEALACGLPVVVSAAAGSSEILKEGLEDLVLPDSEDAGKLAGILAGALSQPKGALGAVCRRVAEGYSEEACVSRYETLYRRIVDRRRDASGSNEAAHS